MSRYRRDNTPGATWFFTVVTYKRQRTLCDEPVRDALREVIAQTRINWPIIIDAWVLLPDHLHCIWTLPNRKKQDLSGFLGKVRRQFNHDGIGLRKTRGQRLEEMCGYFRVFFDDFTKLIAWVSFDDRPAL